jgi:hypothetical protein
MDVAPTGVGSQDLGRAGPMFGGEEIAGRNNLAQGEGA